MIIIICYYDHVMGSAITTDSNILLLSTPHYLRHIRIINIHYIVIFHEVMSVYVFKCI